MIVVEPLGNDATRKYSLNIRGFEDRLKEARYV